MSGGDIGGHDAAAGLGGLFHRHDLLQGVVCRLGDFTHRGLHLRHGGGDTGSLLTLQIQLAAGALGGFAVVLSGLIELVGGFGEFHQHVTHLYNQGVDL